MSAKALPGKRVKRDFERERDALAASRGGCLTSFRRNLTFLTVSQTVNITSPSNLLNCAVAY